MHDSTGIDVRSLTLSLLLLKMQLIKISINVKDDTVPINNENASTNKGKIE